MGIFACCFGYTAPVQLNMNLARKVPLVGSAANNAVPTEDFCEYIIVEKGFTSYPFPPKPLSTLNFPNPLLPTLTAAAYGTPSTQTSRKFISKDLTSAAYPVPSTQLSCRASLIGHPIHNSQIVIKNFDPQLKEQQKLLYKRMQEVHTFFYDHFKIEAVSPQQLFPPLHGITDVDDAYWSGDFKEGWYFGGRSVSVETVAHEYIHAVVDRLTGLKGDGEQGALHESLADVFASIFKQYQAKQTVDKADWEMTDEGQSYRSLKTFPPQGKYPKLVNEVHADAAIPDYAFYWAATRIKGNSWDVIGKIWCEAVTKIVPNETFFTFSRKTLAVAEKKFPEVEKIVRKAWSTVGVEFVLPG